VTVPRFLSVSLLCLATLSIAWPAGAATTSEADQRLQAGIDRLVARPDGPPGAIVVVQRGDRREIFRGGVANIASGALMQPWMHMRIASTAKAYSGGVALSLVDDGTMSLDDTVGELLPWTNPDWHEVTLGQALHHTSGIPDFTDSQDFVEAFIASPDVAPWPRKLLSYVADRDLRFEPDTRYRYSNSDNIVVALMAVAATGDPYVQLLRALVFHPLGLRHTSLPRGADMPTPFMHGYQTGDGDELDDVSGSIAGGWAWASGGIVATPLDQNRFIRAYVGRGLFGASTQDAQFDFVAGGSEPTGPGRNRAGLAIFRYRTPCGVVFGHTGNTFGFTQFFAATRSGSRSVVVSVNRQITQTAQPPDLFRDLRSVFTRAVCSALAPS
jgi:D-alanyl-D-alanine carboxypeptidase